MPATRAAIENEVVVGLRGILGSRFFAFSVLTNGANPDLNAPIRRAIRNLGYDTADPITVADADLVPFAGWKLERLIDGAKLEVLKDCLGQALLCDVKTGEDSQSLSQLSGQLHAQIAYFEQRIAGASIGPAMLAPMYGAGLPNDPTRPVTNPATSGYWPSI